MKRVLRLMAGMAIGSAALMLLIATGLVEPPESLSRRLAIIAATYPGPGGTVSIERIPCAPMRHLRFYVVCTDDCEGVWRIVGVHGLVADTLANLNKLPPDPPETMRRVANDAIAADHLRLSPGGARELIGCYLRLAGLHPERVLGGGDRERLERAGTSAADLEAFAESLDDTQATARIQVRESADGFASRFEYWDADAPGQPVVEMTWTLRRDGTIELYRARELPLKDDNGSGNTPGTPPI